MTFIYNKDGFVEVGTFEAMVKKYAPIRHGNESLIGAAIESNRDGQQ